MMCILERIHLCINNISGFCYSKSESANTNDGFDSAIKEMELKFDVVVAESHLQHRL